MKGFLVKHINTLVFFTLLLVTLAQYKFFINYDLGPISDDWTLLLGAYKVDPPTLINYLKFPVVRSRPFWFTVIPVEQWLFGTNTLFYHATSACFVFLIGFFLFLCFKQTLKSYSLAFLISLVAITFPNHSASYFYITSQLAAFSTLTAVLGWFFYLRKNFIFKYIVSTFLFTYASLSYETALFFILSIFLFEFSKDKLFPIRLKTRVKYLPFLFTPPLFLVYRAFVKYALGRPHAQSLHPTENSIIDMFKNFLETISHLYGPGFYDYTIFAVKDVMNLGNVVLVSMLVILIIFAARACQTKDQTENKTDNKALQTFAAIGFFAFTICILLVFMARRKYRVGNTGDRTWIAIAIFIALWLVELLRETFKKRFVYLVAIIVALFTMVSWHSKRMYAKTVATEKIFFKYAQQLNLQDNLLVVFDSDISATQRKQSGYTAPVLGNIWTISSMLADKLDLDRFVCLGKSNLLYKMPYRYHVNDMYGVFENSPIYKLTFFREDIEKWAN